MDSGLKKLEFRPFETAEMLLRRENLTEEDILLLKCIKRTILKGNDVEIRAAPGGRMKILEVQKRNIAIG